MLVKKKNNDPFISISSNETKSIILTIPKHFFITLKFQLKIKKL